MHLEIGDIHDVPRQTRLEAALRQTLSNLGYDPVITWKLSRSGLPTQRLILLPYVPNDMVAATRRAITGALAQAQIYGYVINERATRETSIEDGIDLPGNCQPACYTSPA